MRLTRSRKPSPPAQGPVCKVQGGGVGWRFRAPARVWVHGASWGMVGVQGRSWPGSEAEGFLPEPERCVKTPLVEAQSTAIARAMARICNDGQRCFGVQGGHGQKTLSLSGLPRAAVRCARWRLAVQVAANAVRGPQGGAIQVGHGLQAVSRRTGRALCARGQLCPRLSAGSARRHRTLEKAGQVYNKKTHGRRPWQAGRSTQTQRYAGRALSRHAGNAPAKGAWPVRTAQMQRSGKTGEPPTPPWPKRPKLPQWAHRYNRGWEGRGRGLHKATHGPGAGVRRPGRQQPSRLAGFHCNNWHFPRWGSGNEGARLLRCNIGWSTCFLGIPSNEAGVSLQTGDAAAGSGSWPWRPPQCGFPRPVWQTRVPDAF